jgi:EAL domain-containing protein (putative c-di-GMP-specific phosphodiesterase class I)
LEALAKSQTEPGLDKHFRFLDYKLRSAFQPIFSLSHRRSVGFESLVRGQHLRTGVPVSPIELFKLAAERGEVLSLDQQCQALHVASFAAEAPENRWLFLNIDSMTLQNRRYLDDHIPRAMADAGLPFHRLVVEVLENAAVDESALVDSLQHFRSLGALVALDDFGVGHSNFERIWRLAPDIIKLDRSIIRAAEHDANDNLRRMLPNLVGLMHEAGSLVLVEGIETEAQAAIALDADADFAQGFFLGRPEPGFTGLAEGQNKLDQVTRRVARSQQESIINERGGLAPYIQTVRSLRGKFKGGLGHEQTCRPLLDMPGVIRCSLFDENGQPVVEHLSDLADQTADLRFAPVTEGSGGTWFRRQYFRSAMNEPRRIQVSKPYLSSTEGCMCIVISVSSKSSPRRVFCCKIAWSH